LSGSAPTTRTATPATPTGSPRTSPTTRRTSSPGCRRPAARAIGEQTKFAVDHAQASWEVEHGLEKGDEAVIEFANHWNDPRSGERRTVRGTEWFRFAPDGRITEVRAYYHREGSCRSRLRRVPDELATQLQDVVLPDQDGNEVRLGDLWSDRPVALVWLRHYG
jgi:hypothetical protein